MNQGRWMVRVSVALLSLLAAACGDTESASVVELADAGLLGPDASEDPVAAGGTCLHSDECGDGLICVADGVEGSGRCREVCDPVRPSCGAGLGCLSVSGGMIPDAHDGACVPVRAELQSELAACGRSGEVCGAGLSCLRVLGEGAGGHCLRLCVTDEECPGSSRCVLEVGLSGGELLGACASRCTSSSECAPGQRCHAVSGGGLCAE